MNENTNAMPPEEQAENDRDARAEKLESTFSYDGYQVVRKELFAHLRDPAIVIRKDSITFNTACITGLEDVVYVHVMFNSDLKRIVVRGCDENDCEAIVVNLVESGAISTAQTIMNQIQAAGIPTVWFNRPVSTNNEEAANLFLNNPASAFVGTNFEDAGVMQGELIGQYLVEHYNDIDLNGDGKISYIMFKGDEANQEAIARTALAVEYANKALVAAGKPEIEFYDASNANKYLVDPNGSWSNVFSSEQMQTVLSMYNEGNGNMVELVICNNDDMAYGAVMALQNAGYNHGEGTTAIPVFGVDATDVAKDLINNGYMVGTIKQDNVGMADAVATITANLIAGKENKFEGLNENYVIVDNWFVQIPYAVYTGE